MKSQENMFRLELHELGLYIKDVKKQDAERKKIEERFYHELAEYDKQVSRFFTSHGYQAPPIPIPQGVQFYKSLNQVQMQNQYQFQNRNQSQPLQMEINDYSLQQQQQQQQQQPQQQQQQQQQQISVIPLHSDEGDANAHEQEKQNKPKEVSQIEEIKQAEDDFDAPQLPSENISTIPTQEQAKETLVPIKTQNSNEFGKGGQMNPLDNLDYDDPSQRLRDTIWTENPNANVNPLD
ncbi:hypothetical protein RFI_28171, partial [Reticulomyxa filosa]